MKPDDIRANSKESDKNQNIQQASQQRKKVNPIKIAYENPSGGQIQQAQDGPSRDELQASYNRLESGLKRADEANKKRQEFQRRLLSKENAQGEHMAEAKVTTSRDFDDNLAKLQNKGKYREEVSSSESENHASEDQQKTKMADRLQKILADNFREDGPERLKMEIASAEKNIDIAWKLYELGEYHGKYTSEDFMPIKMRNAQGQTETAMRVQGQYIGQEHQLPQEGLAILSKFTVAFSANNRKFFEAIKQQLQEGIQQQVNKALQRKSIENPENFLNQKIECVEDLENALSGLEKLDKANREAKS